MKSLLPILTVLSSVSLALGTTHLARAQEGTQVMVLGTYHFANPGLDMINVEVDDVLSDRRQEELFAVIDGLLEFEPTKILLEMPPSAEEAFNAHYRSYLEGTHELGRNEHDQLGKRLAEALGHERLYGIDASQELDIEGALRLATELGQEAVAASTQGLLTRIRTEVGAVHGPHRTTSQMLRSHNGGDEVLGDDLDEAFYMTLVEAGDEANPLGATVVAAWYERNLRIFANLLRVIEPADERILVIYGSGHRRLLEDFIAGHPELQLVSALDYLPE